MSITVILTVGWDPWLLAAQSGAWRAAGYIAVSAATISEAFRHFKAGDFDLVLLGKSIPREEREKLTHQIRETGARAPVVDAANLPDDFASLERAVDRVAVKPGGGSAEDLP